MRGRSTISAESLRTASGAVTGLRMPAAKTLGLVATLAQGTYHLGCDGVNLRLVSAAFAALLVWLS